MVIGRVNSHIRLKLGRGCQRLGRWIDPKAVFTQAWNIKMRETLHSLLDQCLARGGEIAVAHQRVLRVARWSYARLAQTAFQFARELEARGVGKGDRVL